MTFWWSVPLFFIHLGRFSIKYYFASYLHYYVIFGFTLVFGSLLVKDNKARAWDVITARQKYFWLCSRYALNIGLIWLIIFILHYFYPLEHFGSDPEGSVEMAFVPSVVACALICFSIDAGRFIYKRLTKN